MKFRKKIRISIIQEIAILFAIGVLTTGILTYFGQRAISDTAVRNQTVTQAKQVANEIKRAVREYPAARWLMTYWYTNAYAS